MKKNKEIIRKLILIICVCIFLYSSYSLLSIFYEYYQIDQSNSSLRAQFIITDEKKDDEKKYLIIDWEGLLKKNPDVIAWIDIPDTNINYPVLKGETNDTYLRHDINRKYTIAGSIFVDYRNDAGFTDLNTVIYGHNMKNDSMFSDILKYLSPEFVQEHPNIYIYLPNGTVSKYKIVSGHKIQATDPLYNTAVQDIKEYYKAMLLGSVFNVDFDQEAQNPVITLSTCATYDIENTTRAVIHAVLERKDINPEEKME